jgi:hypothetical protein
MYRSRLRIVVCILTLFACTEKNALPQNLITGSTTWGTVLNLTSTRPVQLKQLIGNNKVSFGAMTLDGKENKVSLDVKAVSLEVDLNKGTGELTADLAIVQVFVGSERSDGLNFVGLQGKLGRIRIRIELDFRPGMGAITGTTAGTNVPDTPFRIKIYDDPSGSLLKTISGSSRTLASYNRAPSVPSSPAPATGSKGVPLTQLLRWTCSDPDGDVLKYDVYFGVGNPPSKVASDQTATDYKPNSLLSGLDYSWKIVAKDGCGGETSGPVWTFMANSPPTKPLNRTPDPGSSQSSSSNILTWSCSDPDGDLIMYDVYFGTSSNPPKVSSTQTSTSYNAGTLQPGTQYYWKVVAQDGKGVDAFSDVWSYKTKAKTNSPPVKPSPVSPANGGTNMPVTQTVSWSCSDPDGDALTYDVYFGTSSNPSKVSSGQSGMSYSPGTMQMGVQYYWKVVAKDGKGGEMSGDVWTFKTKTNAPPTKPSNPNPANNATGVATSVTASWICSDPDGDGLKYDVYVGPTSSPSKVASDQTKQNYTLTGLKSKTRYYWKVVAKDSKGGETLGDIWNFTTK